jgi:hypothetical protein
MKPTCKLRIKQTSSNCAFLQQWWAVFREGQETPVGEWRNLPKAGEEENNFGLG